jgi:hypothetical protein
MEAEPRSPATLRKLHALVSFQIIRIAPTCDLPGEVLQMQKWIQLQPLVDESVEINGSAS